MFAVIASGGKQHRVAEGEVLKLEKLNAEPGESVTFDQVLMVGSGEQVTVGKPYVDGSTVEAEVLRQDRDKKIRILKFRRRQNYMRRQGHRQSFTEVRITSIKA
ncbi:MAG: 50S ribosomal protein L21 [Pseudomonadota bacterium]